ncbi:MAG: hypothetical protein ACLRI8_03475 [Agathobacter rectalis]
MSYKIGAENFLYYQSVFGFGQKTGVDLPVRLIHQRSCIHSTI